MKKKIFWLMICIALGSAGCATNPSENSARQNAPNNSGGQSAGGTIASANSAAKAPPSTNADNQNNASDSRAPRTVRDFFNLLPQKYFTLEGCDQKTDRNCERARAELIKTFLEVEDTANGYLKLSCDGGQSCLRMALFKRPDGSYLIAVHTLHEADETNYFLDYKDGAWTDVSAQVVPEFSKQLIYELPRVGTTVQVYKKVYPEPEFSERGGKAYDLEWNNGKFSVKR